VNRWRKQLGLKPIDQQAYVDRKLPEADCEIVSITTPAGSAVLLDLVGEMSPSGGGPPFAQAPFAGPMQRPTVGPPPAGGGSDKPESTVPDHWKPGKLNSFRVEAFEVAEDGELVEITISSAGGNPLDNINRWRGQVDLPAWTIEELQSELMFLPVQGDDAGYVRLVGPKQTILGVIHRGGDRTWFIKLTGPNKLAAREQTHFEDFVKSLKF
jgi:hypothetical protein